MEQYLREELQQQKNPEKQQAPEKITDSKTKAYEAEQNNSNENKNIYRIHWGKIDEWMDQEGITLDKGYQPEDKDDQEKHTEAVAIKEKRKDNSYMKKPTAARIRRNNKPPTK